MATALAPAPPAVPLTWPADSAWWRKFDVLLSLRLPDLAGKTVLDVDACDGYFAFVAERFGASRVVSVDARMWPRPGGRERFERTHRALRSRVEALELGLLDIRPETVGRFDVALCVGALQRVRDPLPALAALAGVTDELLVLDVLAGAPRGARALRDVMRTLRAAGFADVVSYPIKRARLTRMIGLPADARAAVTAISAAPWRGRGRLLRDCARSGWGGRRVVVHAHR